MSYLAPTALISFIGWRAVPGAVFRIGWCATGIAAQFFRYRSFSAPVQRQQSKWVILGMGFAVGVYTLLMLPPVFVPGLDAVTEAGVLFRLISLALYTVAVSTIPLTIGIAMLRYRLWDVDLLINRTLVYGALTVIIVTIYIGSVTILEAALRTLSGQESNLATMISTLLSAVALMPLRRRIQTAIDRRFYRQKYNAEQVLAAWGATIRDQVDAEQLRAALLGVVDETMQPARAALWLRGSAMQRPSDAAPNNR